VEQFLQQTINGLAAGSVLALLALAVTLLWGVLGILNFAHSQLLTAGAVGTWFAVGAGLPSVPAILAGVLVAVVVALVLNTAVVAPLRRRQAPEFAYVVATIGAGLIISQLLRAVFGPIQQPFPRGGFPAGNLELGSLIVPQLQVLVLAVGAAVMVALGLWLNRTRSGRALRTVAYSRETAELLGVRSTRVYALAFAVSGALAALGGTFVALDLGSLTYNVGDLLLLSVFTVVVIGGMGSPKGAMVGGLLLGLAQVYATVYVSSVFRQAVAMILILAFLMVRPNGIFGAEEATRV
jgi:branched-chain amino acid transport system permease protein